MNNYTIILILALVFALTGAIVSHLIYKNYRFSGSHCCPPYWDGRYPWAPWVYWMATVLVPVAILTAFTMERPRAGFWVRLLGAILWFFTLAAFAVYLFAAKHGKKKLLNTWPNSERYPLASSHARLSTIHPETGVDEVVYDVNVGEEYCIYTVTEKDYGIGWGHLIGQCYTEKNRSVVYHISQSVRVEPYEGENPFTYDVEYEGTNTE